MRKFMDQYEAYACEVNIANAQHPGSAQIQRAPLSACIDPLSVDRIAYWEIEKVSHDLTDEDWKLFFLGAKDCDPVDMSKLDAAMAKLKIDTTMQSAESRVSKLVSDFEAVLVRLSMEGFAEAEPKLTVDYLVASVQPPAVRASVKELMKLNENRSLKKDARDFKHWLADYMRRYGEFEPLIAAAVPATAKPHKLPAATKIPKAGKAPKVVAVVNVDKIPKSNFTQEKCACFKCLSTENNVFKCPKVADGEAKLLMERARSIWKETKSVTVVETVDVAEVSLDNAVMCAARVVCVAGQAVSLDASFDSGADQSVVPPATLTKLKKQGRNVLVTKLKTPMKVQGFVGPAHTVTEEATMDLRFETDAGPLMLTNVKCWVSTGNLPANVGDILLSRAIMYKLGFDPRAMLREAASFTDAIDMADAVSHSGVVQAVLAVSHELVDDLAEEEEELLPLEMDSCFPDMVVEAVTAGCGSEFAANLAALLDKYVDVFRLSLGRDPPVKMPPLKVHLANGARPIRCKARRYSLPQREFMQQHVKELEAAGFVYRNPASRWASAPLIVRKPHTKDEFRMTVDLRPINSQTEQIAWPMPMLEVVVDHLSGAVCFFLLDFFKGYWQFALDPSCQEMFSFLTDTGVYSSTRVMQGGSDSVSYCQSTVQEMFSEQLYKGLLAWLDDLLGYHRTREGLLGVLADVLAVCADKGLKLHPKKCSFYVTEARWCGRIISGTGVKHDPARVEALQQLPSPVTGADLQQYVCAINWMRMSIPGYNVLVQPLTEMLERVFAAGGGKRTKQAAAAVLLEDVGWSGVHDDCLAKTKAVLGNVVELCHPDPQQRLCVFADASEGHWGSVITQVPPDQLHRPIDAQNHQPLMFLSGTFTGAAGRWAIVEKEAYAIVETLVRADYLLHPAAGFNLYTDHRNLKFIFSPTSVVASVPKYTAQKLERLALLLMGYSYVIHDIPGEVNVWADLLSRWGSTLPSICAISQQSLLISPLRDEKFVWPTFVSIAEAQVVAPDDVLSRMTKSLDAVHLVVLASGQMWPLRLVDGVIWVPAAAAAELQLRLCVCAHASLAGHRTAKATLASLESFCQWTGMKGDVDFLCVGAYIVLVHLAVRRVRLARPSTRPHLMD
ncbi:hypothetical protein AaE_016248 [Aphanomyces astaci]|uniref:Reverse transcriptase domain-containing protein n=2 Tax=Aphanomyces astaci TaxID=112090 RepID=A0A6A4YZG8_APHAT|nr:hypothetical protein AaE_016248 [Aphanomyces astaci]